MSNNADTLALLGGPAVLTAPLKPSVVVDEDERKEILEVLDNQEFSRFMGSPTPDIEELLRLPSAEAMDKGGRYYSFLGGQKVREFERDFAARFGAKFAMSVNAATTGLTTALAACGAGPGDEVITTCVSFNATALAILGFNSIPVFVDISADNFCLDPEKVRQAITQRTKVILAVHLLGNPADMDAIMAIAREHGLKVVEDTAQAPGTLYKGRPLGTIGDAGVFSFQETKNMMTGEGGMILTNDPEIARAARLIRNHGESVPDETWSDADLANLVGQNYRMTELTAAMGLAQLRKLDENNRVRTENAVFLAKELQGLPGLDIPLPRPGVVVHLMPMLYDAEATGVPRKVILAAIRAEGVPVGSGYVRTMPENPLFQRKVAYGDKGCPWTCPLWGGQVDYSPDNFPVARDLLYKRFIWFYHVHRPNGIEEMRSVAAAFKKVFNNLDILKDYDPDKAHVGYKW